MTPLRAISLLILATSTLGAPAWEPPSESVFATEEIAPLRAEALLPDPETPKGIWIFPDEDCEVAVVPVSESRADTYKIVVLFEPDLLPPPGTVIGYLMPTASPATWHATLYTSTDDDAMKSPREFTATFSYARQGEEASLTFESTRTTATFNPLGLIPFLRRILKIRRDDPAKKIPYGLRRIAPTLRLRYL